MKGVSGVVRGRAGLNTDRSEGGRGGAGMANISASATPKEHIGTSMRARPRRVVYLGISFLHVALHVHKPVCLFHHFALQGIMDLSQLERHVLCF